MKSQFSLEQIYQNVVKIVLKCFNIELIFNSPDGNKVCKANFRLCEVLFDYL